MKEYNNHRPRFIERRAPRRLPLIRLPKGVSAEAMGSEIVMARDDVRGPGMIFFMEAGRVGLRCPVSQREIECEGVHEAFQKAHDYNYQFPS